ncbi:MAG: hypothetical protein WCX46_00885 [Candidatus Paceibacterota bacterium]
MKKIKPGQISVNRAQFRELFNAFYEEAPRDYIKKALRMKKNPKINIPSKAKNLEQAKNEYFSYSSKYKKTAALGKFFSFNPSKEELLEMYNKIKLGAHKRWAIRIMFSVLNK